MKAFIALPGHVLYESSPELFATGIAIDPLEAAGSYEPLPKEFKALIEPNYNEVTVGEWSLKKMPYGKRTRWTRWASAYFNLAAQISSRNAWTLRKGNQVWMSLTPMELESQGYHARMARGNVIVAGLGMGVLVYNLLRNPKVKHIQVLEQDPLIADLLTHATDWFKPSERLTIDVNLDARDYVPASKPDMLIADIWPFLGDERAEADVKRMQANIQADVVGWWGQEIDLIAHLNALKRYPPITDEDLLIYQKQMGFTLLGAQHPAYKQMALKAAKVFSQITMHKQKERICLK